MSPQLSIVIAVQGGSSRLAELLDTLEPIGAVRTRQPMAVRMRVGRVRLAEAWLHRELG
jgi:hypothetical protein